VSGTDTAELPELDVPREDIIIEARSAIIGQSRITPVDRFIFVTPSAYGALPIRDRYAVATLIGELNATTPADGSMTVFLLGPGRWGTSSPSLGIPVTFGNISRVAILGEIVAMHENLVPDVSLGTHFINELVEMDMLYLALFPGQAGSHLDEGFFETTPNRLLELVPAAGRWVDTVKVVDPPRDDNRRALLRADAVRQHATCCLGPQSLLSPAPTPTD
jgi:hypothetical protein